MKEEEKTEIIGLMVFIVGAFFVCVGLFDLFGLSGEGYVGGLTLILVAVSSTKYKMYAEYYVPSVLICGTISTVIGINLAYATHEFLVCAIGLGLLAGGICNLIVILGGRDTHCLARIEEHKLNTRQ